MMKSSRAVRVIDEFVEKVFISRDGEASIAGRIVASHPVHVGRVGHFHGPHWHDGPCFGGAKGDKAPW